jgi:signal transduction histidine kinase
MLNNYNFATKLQLIFLPLIITPVALLIMLLALTIPSRLISAQEELLLLQLERAYNQIDEGYELLVSAGIEDDLFFRQTRINRIIENIRQIDVETASFGLYDSSAGALLIEPGEPENFLEKLGSAEFREVRDFASRDTVRMSTGSETYLLRHFPPWNLVIGLQVRIPALYRPVFGLLGLFGSVGLIIIVTAALLIRRFSRSLSSPLAELAETVSDFGSGDFRRRVSPRGRDEIARLSGSFNDMAERISDFARELERKVEQRTLELSDNIDALQRTQKQLIESEKLASLGSVVAGVSHEINTPLGVGITSASFLEHQLNRMEDLYRGNQLTKSELDAIISRSRESLNILMDNLNRAQTLVQNFKEVSADQLVDEQRTFQFRDYLEEILSGLHNQLKRRVGKVRIEGPDELFVYSHPGAYWQIFSNLIQNALIHAFPEDMERAPEITISIEADEGDLNIVVADNGVGMDEVIRETAFEPFVTTRRGAGGTGLGLNIVFNIVQRLNGVISLESSARGTSIFIQIPGIIREANEEDDSGKPQEFSE